MTLARLPIGLPKDTAQWIALALAVVIFAVGAPVVRAPARPRRFVAACALMACTLSAAYVVLYLRGGPRIIDATSYFLEARALAEGFFSFPVRAPETTVLGRFLVRSVHGEAAHAAVIFPPGYPLVLAIGFLAGAPLAVGPILAAAITVATFDLARSVGRDLDLPAVPPIACVFSVLCAALRYHTADTMSHGLAALCFTMALALAFRALDAHALGQRRRAWLLAGLVGLAAGWLFATRPVSALALGPPLLLAIFGAASRSAAPLPTPARTAALVRAWLPIIFAFVVFALPGVVVFLVHQHAATGVWGASSQRAYYALSDGPADCFRYGFGAGIGCLGEHGDFVRDRLPRGYGFVAAIATTSRRLVTHLVDAGNLELLAILIPIGALRARHTARGRVLALAVLTIVAAYAPFYFDGNYPGGGARFYADVLPVEHVLMAVAVASCASRTKNPDRWALAAVATALLGFAFRAGFDHGKLRDREGGRPMFEPREVARAGASHAMVFVATDHGFNLGFDPERRDGLDVVRYHADALDRIVWDSHGRPPAFLYRFKIPRPGDRASVAVNPLSFANSGPLVIEGESLWPPIEQSGGYGLPDWASGTCASNSRWLALHPARTSAATSVTVALPARVMAGASVVPRIALSGRARGRIVLRVDVDAPEIRSFEAVPNGSPFTCVSLRAVVVAAAARDVRLTVTRDSASGDSLVALDSVEVIPSLP